MPVGTSQVQLGKDLLASKSLVRSVCSRNRVRVFLGATIKLDKIYTNAYFPILLRNIDSWSAPRATAGPDDSLIYHVHELLLDLVHIMERDGTGWNFNWCSIASLYDVVCDVGLPYLWRE